MCILISQHGSNIPTTCKFGRHGCWCPHPTICNRAAELPMSRASSWTSSKQARPPSKTPAAIAIFPCNRHWKLQTAKCQIKLDHGLFANETQRKTHVPANPTLPTPAPRKIIVDLENSLGGSLPKCQVVRSDRCNSPLSMLIYAKPTSVSCHVDVHIACRIFAV